MIHRNYNHVNFETIHGKPANFLLISGSWNRDCMYSCVGVTNVSMAVPFLEPFLTNLSINVTRPNSRPNGWLAGWSGGGAILSVPSMVLPQPLPVRVYGH